MKTKRFLPILVFGIFLLSFTYQQRILMKKFDKKYGSLFTGAGIKTYFSIQNMLSRGKWERAYKKLIWLNKLYPSIVNVYEELFIVSFKLGKRAQAIKYFKEAHKFGSRNQEIIDFYDKEFATSGGIP